MIFDRSLLPKALFEFVVLTDTHYMLEPRGRTVEFESRLKQTRRAETALRLSASLQPAFVIHLGDLVQEYPDTQAFPTAMVEALEQLRRCEVAPYYVAVNHDVGDKLSSRLLESPQQVEVFNLQHATITHVETAQAIAMASEVIDGNGPGPLLLAFVRQNPLDS